MKWTGVFAASFLFSAFVNAQSVVVDVTLNPMGDFKAKTSDVKGSIVKQGDGFEAKDVVVSLKNLKTGLDTRDKHMKDKYLEVNKFPDATLVSAKGSGGKASGIMRIRGTEKPVSGTYKISGNNVDGEFKLKLSDFGIADVNYKGVGVEDEVTVHVQAPMSAGAAAAATAPAKAPAKKTK
jgi:Uncharacterized conserved protein